MNMFMMMSVIATDSKLNRTLLWRLKCMAGGLLGSHLGEQVHKLLGPLLAEPGEGAHARDQMVVDQVIGNGNDQASGGGGHRLVKSPRPGNYCDPPTPRPPLPEYFC